MEEKFKEQMLDDFFKEIVAKSKEVSLLNDSVFGLLKKASELIESKLCRRFMYKSIVTKKKHAEWRVTRVVVVPCDL